MSLSIDQRGISIIEAMLAITLLTVGVLSLIQLFPMSLKISKGAQYETIAANLAQAKFEEMFSLGYDGIPVGLIEARHRLASTTDNPYYNFEREASSTYVNGSLNAVSTSTGMKRINVVVYYHSQLATGTTQSLPLTTIISQK